MRDPELTRRRKEALKQLNPIEEPIESAESLVDRFQESFNIDGLHPSEEVNGNYAVTGNDVITKDPYARTQPHPNSVVRYQSYMNNGNNPFAQYYGMYGNDTFAQQAQYYNTNPNQYMYAQQQYMNPGQYYYPGQVQEQISFVPPTMQQTPPPQGMSVYTPQNMYPQYPQYQQPQYYQQQQRPWYAANTYQQPQQKPLYYNPGNPAFYIDYSMLHKQQEMWNGNKPIAPYYTDEQIKYIESQGAFAVAKATARRFKPENVSQEDWDKEIDKRFHIRNKEDYDRDLYIRDHTYGDYVYDKNYERRIKSKMQVYCKLADGQMHRVTPEPDPETGYWEMIKTKLDDINDDIDQENFFKPFEDERKRWAAYTKALDEFYRTDPLALAASSGDMDKYHEEMYKYTVDHVYKPTQKAIKFKRRVGTTASATAYRDLMWQCGVVPIPTFDEKTNPAFLGDNDYAKLAYDYQNNPELYGPGVKQLLENKVKANYERRREYFKYRIDNNLTKVNTGWDDTLPDSEIIPSPQIIGSDPILPDENGIIRTADGRVIYNSKLGPVLSEEDTRYLLEYEADRYLEGYMERMGGVG